MVSHDPLEVRVVRRSVGVLCIQWWNTSMWCLCIVMHVNVKRGKISCTGSESPYTHDES